MTARTCTVIELTTASGLVGFGEAFGSPKAVVEIVGELSSRFLEKEPYDIPNLIVKTMNEQYHAASKGLVVSALSGIEVASWDLIGKLVNQPVCKLLGGKVRNKFLAYGSTGYIMSDKRDEVLEQQVEDVINKGLKAVKIKIGTSLKDDVRRVEIVRKKSADLQIMVDMNGNYTADVAIRSIKALEPYGIYWVEEPVPPHDYEGFRKIKEAALHVPIASGEAEYTRYGFREIVQKRLVDIIQPDLCKCGGFYEAKAISAMAQANNIRISPHVWGGVIGRAASAQFMASIPHYPHSLREPEPIMFEYDLGVNGLRDELGRAPLTLRGGWLEIEEKPGIGVEIDREKLDFYRIK